MSNEQEQKWRKEFDIFADETGMDPHLNLRDEAYSIWQAARAIDAQKIAELEAQVRNAEAEALAKIERLELSLTRTENAMCNVYAQLVKERKKAVPEGWKIVPVNITKSQFDSMWRNLMTQERFNRTRVVLSMSEISEIFSMVAHTTLSAAPQPDDKA